jgi:hypothetical protein
MLYLGIVYPEAEELIQVLIPVKSGAAARLEKTALKRLSCSDGAARETNASSHSLVTDNMSSNVNNETKKREARFKNASPAARTVSTWLKTSGW